MTTQPETDLESLRQSLSEYKAELAKVIAGMQLGGDRKTRRDLTRRLAACKRRAKTLSRAVVAIMVDLPQDHEARPELQTAALFLGKVQDLGEGKGQGSSSETAE